MSRAEEPSKPEQDSTRGPPREASTSFSARACAPLLDLPSATVTEVRVGLRPSSRDDRPVLGRLPGWSNVHVATGHGTEGLLLGPYTAALVADSIVSDVVPEQIAALSPERFATGPGHPPTRARATPRV